MSSSDLSLLFQFFISHFSREGMKEAGFNLRKWMSSSKRLMDWIDEGVVPAKEVVKLSEEDST